MFFQEKLVFPSKDRSNYRIPSIIATKDGTVLAFCNDRKDTLSDHAIYTTLVYATKAPNGEWTSPEELAGFDGWAFTMGSAVYDAMCDTVLVTNYRNPMARKEFGTYTDEEKAELDRREQESIEKAKPFGIHPGAFLLTSTDQGKTWSEAPLQLSSVEQVHSDGSVHTVTGQTHGAAHGIQLQYGPYKGRLLCASRTCIGTYIDWDGVRKCVYNNAIYSDDHGKTWKTANCVQLATGEGTLIERADGSILYNSRAFYQDGKRYLATSTDGGATYGDFRTDDFLQEEKRIGCNASFIRIPPEQIQNRNLLPEGAEDVTVFCNPRADTRRNMSACVSFDSGKTWAFAKAVYDGPAAYSSLVFNPQDQHFYLMYEKGDDAHPKKLPYTFGISIAEFDLEWLLKQ
ncbi:MAG: exo-alpha-sialidase [Clostridia bacterium]|nr:exo-alpha-sialidase [Clostridia bacterium]MBR2908345.1 exo-alpha-sialidase [Clostridia bacterium]